MGTFGNSLAKRRGRILFMISKPVSNLKTLPSYPIYGSKTWANVLLGIAIDDLKNTERVLSSRRLLVVAILNLFKENGLWWQEVRLHNQINLAIKKNQFSFTDERSEADINPQVEGDSS